MSDNEMYVGSCHIHFPYLRDDSPELTSLNNFSPTTPAVYTRKGGISIVVNESIQLETELF